VTRFHERFAAEMGVAPADWRQRQRIGRARQLLRHTDRSITDIAHTCGFNTSQYFATCFKQHTGQTPTAYRRNCS
jgi:AraC-like DNA-binding protein